MKLRSRISHPSSDLMLNERSFWSFSIVEHNVSLSSLLSFVMLSLLRSVIIPISLIIPLPWFNSTKLSFCKRDKPPIPTGALKPCKCSNGSKDGYEYCPWQLSNQSLFKIQDLKILEILDRFGNHLYSGTSQAQLLSNWTAQDVDWLSITSNDVKTDISVKVGNCQANELLLDCPDMKVETQIEDMKVDLKCILAREFRDGKVKNFMLLPGVENYRKLRCPEILTAVPGPPEVSWTEFTSQQPSFHIEVHIFSSITHKKFKMDKIRQILKMFKWVILEFTPSFSDRSFRSFSMDEHTALPSSVLNFRTQSLFSSFSFPISSIVPLPGKDRSLVPCLFICALPNVPWTDKCRAFSGHAAVSSSVVDDLPVKVMDSTLLHASIIIELHRKDQASIHEFKEIAFCNFFCCPSLFLLYKAFHCPLINQSIVLNQMIFWIDAQIQKTQFKILRQIIKTQKQNNSHAFKLIIAFKIRAKAVIKDSPFIDAGLVLCCQNTTNGHNCKRQSPTSFQDLL
nr:hypothetical protein PanWU01x14_132440 [Ipomoea batatas]